jgi:hypothetical protein
MPKRKQSWKPGDLFVVPQRDGGGTLGQVLDHIMTNVVSGAFYDRRLLLSGATGPFLLDDDQLSAGLSVTREQLDSGAWQVIGWQPVALA